jgi:Polysaccharide deacetylase
MLRATLGIFIAVALLQACASDKPVAKKLSYVIKEEPVTGFFMPKGVFGKGSPAKALEVKSPISTDTPVVFSSEVLVYASPSTRAYFEAGELDATESKLAWETLLNKYSIPFKVLTNVTQLERSRSGVLILPSSVALSQVERLAIANFRARGGSVLASWLCGVRDENGAWLGFGFMESTLDVKVVGDTSSDKDDNFLMPQGDSPVSHHLPAGQRIWLERVSQRPTLRLSARVTAAHVMDWSRTFSVDKTTSVIAFDELAIAENRTSRSVVLGYPERLWRTADPKHLEAIAHNALSWLRRLPTAHLAAWPSGYSSALVLAVDAAENIVEADLSLAKYLEDIGARATFYTLGDNAAKSAANLKALQDRGHEIAFMGDKFAGFKGQSLETQASRLDSMLSRMKEAGLTVPALPGFHAPTESYDKNTETVLQQKGFGHYISFMDATDARLPFIAPTIAAADGAAASATSAAKDAANLVTIVLPRTQRGPEDATEDGDYEDGIKSFFAELGLVEKMAGLSVIRIPNQGLLSVDQLAEIVNELKTRRDRTWMTTASRIANWWRERERVSVRLEGAANAPVLALNIQGSETIKEAVTVWVNLPHSGYVMTLKPVPGFGSEENIPRIITIDQWRAGVTVAGLAPGAYRWQVYLSKAENVPRK